MLKQPKCLSPDKWTKKMWNIHTMGLYSVLKKESKSAIGDNMDEPWGHYAKWNEPVTEDKSCASPIISSVQWLSRSDSLRPHEPQHTRPPCPSPTPGVYPNPCPLSQWCHPPISSSVVPFSSCPQSFPASGSFQMSQFFASGGQSNEVSASASVLPMNIQDWFPLGLTGCISLQSKGLSRVFSNTRGQKHRFFSSQLSLWPSSHIHTWPLENP